MTYIYGLKDPNTGEIRYIGKANNPKARFSQHLALTKTDTSRHKKSWIESLLRVGQKPELVILERVPETQWEDREIWWIQHGKDSGWPLTNISSGGRQGFVTSDHALDLLDALGLFLDEPLVSKLDTIDFDTLHAIAHDAARAGVPFARGYFSGKNNGAVSSELIRQIVVARISEALQG